MLFDRVSFSTPTIGFGPISVGAATDGFRTLAGASIPDGAVVEYAIEDGTAWETATGVVGGGGTTLTRVLSQSSTGSLLNLSGAAKVFLTPIAAGYNQLTPATGWGAYVHTGAAQTLVANTKATLVNNAGTIIHTEKPADIASFYSGGLITGRVGDSIAVGVELTFTPSDGTASSLYLAIDIGGAIGELYPKDFAILKGNGVAHRISYNVAAYTLDTWAANGGAIKILADGPGAVTAMRYVIHRMHKA